MMVSAIIPTFNRLNYIRRAIDSVLAQTVPVDELIVIDDGSTDGTAEAIRNWYGSRVRVVVQENAGLAGARLRGIQEARGNWIAFLDSDDDWTPGRNEQLLRAAARVPHEVAWIFGDMRVVTDRGDETTLFGEYGLAVPEDLHIFGDSLTVQYPFQFGLVPGSFIRREVLLELGCFRPGLPKDVDLITGFQVACRYRFAAIPFVVGRYFRTSDLASNSMIANELYSPEYFSSRMFCFSQVIKSGRKRPWNKLYASEVRGLYRVLARQRAVERRLAWQQFRYGGFSPKGFAFLVTAMLGPKALQAWDVLAKFRRKHLRSRQDKKVSDTGLQAWVRSVFEEQR